MTGFRIKRCAHLQRRRSEWGRRWDKGLLFGLTVGNCRRSAQSVKHHPGNSFGKKKKKKRNPHSPAELDQGVRLRCFFFSSIFLFLYFFCIASWGLTKEASSVYHKLIEETSCEEKIMGLFFSPPLEYHGRPLEWDRLTVSSCFSSHLDPRLRV